MFVDWPNVLNIVPSSKAVLRVAEAIFFSSSLLAVICSRWESQLAEKMKEAEEGLEQRYVFYVSHLQLAGANRVGGKQGSAGEAWSCSRWLRSIRFCGRSCAMAAIGCHWLPTRPRRDLIDHLNGLRAFWSMGRPGELQEAKEASRTWRVFMQNLCLLLASKAFKSFCAFRLSGAEQEQVIPALLKFAEAAGVAHHGEAAAAGNEIKLSDCRASKLEALPFAVEVCGKRLSRVIGSSRKALMKPRLRCWKDVCLSR